MTKKQHKSPRQTFWIFLVIAALIVSVFSWYNTSAPKADELADADAAASATATQPACTANFVLAIDTTTTMRVKMGEDTRLQASVAAAKAFLTHIDAVNAKNPEGSRSKVGLTTYAQSPQQVTLTDSFGAMRTKLDALTTKGAVNDGNTMTEALKDARNMVTPPADTKIVRGSTYIILISSARNNEGDENDARTAWAMARSIKEKKIIIEAFGFKLTEAASDNPLRPGTPENLVPDLAYSDSHYHQMNTTAAGVAAMKAFAEKTCPRTSLPPVASCSPNLDLAYVVENSTSFGNNANRVELADMVVAKSQAKLHTPNDRSAVLTYSYDNPAPGNTVKQGFTVDPAKAIAAVKALKYNSNQNLNQGVGKANLYIRANQTMEDGAVRPTSVIVLTSQESVFTSAGVDIARRDFTRYGIRYFVVNIGPADANHFAKMENLAAAAGGEAFDLRPGGTNAEQNERAQKAVDAIFTKIDANVANCIDINLSVSKNNVKVGQTLKADIIVENNSRTLVSGAKVTQPLPAGLRELVNGAPSTATTITRDIDLLGPGDSMLKGIELIAVN